MDLAALTDAEFAAHQQAVAVEAQRRQTLARVPEQVQTLADQYAACGGDRTQLAQAIEADAAEATTAEPATATRGTARK